MKLETLHDLLIEHLKDIYDAEHQLTDALPKMEKAATSRELKTAFKQHLTQTEEHIRRLEQVFDALGKKASRKTCKAMKGLIEEGSEMMKADAESDVMDAGLIAAAQRVEHYEMAGYGTARTFAYMLGNQQAAELLQQTLEEEEVTDKKLTQIAGKINIRATQ